MKEFYRKHKFGCMSFLIMFVLFAICYIAQDIMIKRDIAKAKARYEAELRDKGLLPQAERRPARNIYIPADRTGQADRADSTVMFLKSAQETFGQKEESGLEIMDYSSQVEAYQQEVEAIRKAEIQKIKQRQEQQRAAVNRASNEPQRPRTGYNKARTNTDKSGGTKLNKLRTSSL